MSQNFGFLIYENAQPIDILGPWEVFALWKAILKAPIHLYLIAQTKGKIELDSGITLHSHCDFDGAPHLDYLVVPGGRGRIEQSENQPLLHFIQKQSNSCQYILSVCTGMFLLAKSGLLKDKAATTYWRAIPELKTDPHIKVVEERIVKSGKIWTAGGITSGIDLALAFIEEIAGTDTAGQVQLLLEYFPEHKLYTSACSIDKLPPYAGSFGPIQAKLPGYIQEQLNS